jgi:hypothetical protein
LPAGILRHLAFLDLNDGELRRGVGASSHFSFAAAPLRDDTLAATPADMFVPDACPDICEHLELAVAAVVPAAGLIN